MSITDHGERVALDGMVAAGRLFQTVCGEKGGARLLLQRLKLDNVDLLYRHLHYLYGKGLDLITPDAEWTAAEEAARAAGVVVDDDWYPPSWSYGMSNDDILKVTRASNTFMKKVMAVRPNECVGFWKTLAAGFSMKAADNAAYNNDDQHVVFNEWDRRVVSGSESEG